MTNELERVLAKNIEDLAGLIKNGASLISDQAPFLTQEILKYETYRLVSSLVISGFFIMFLLYFSFKYFSFFLKKTCDSRNGEPWILIPFVKCAIAMFIFFIGFLPAVDDLVKLKMSPRVFLIDYCKNWKNSQ